jgi:hypothetical protein
VVGDSGPAHGSSEGSMTSSGSDGKEQGVDEFNNEDDDEEVWDPTSFPRSTTLNASNRSTRPSRANLYIACCVSYHHDAQATWRASVAR